MLGRGFAGAMAGLDIHPDQVRVGAGAFFLQGSDVFKRVGRHHAVVVVGGGDQRCRVANPCLDVVQGRKSQQVPELLRVVARPVFGHPAPANGKGMETQHVHHAHGRQGYFKQVGPLVGDGTYQ